MAAQVLGRPAAAVAARSRTGSMDREVRGRAAGQVLLPQGRGEGLIYAGDGGE
jgi:hypothetical protein